jgi:hypothetical protein
MDVTRTEPGVRDQEAVFTFWSGAAYARPPDILGIWSPAPADRPDVSFGMLADERRQDPGAASMSGLSLWVADFPADSVLAARHARAAEVRLRAVDEALDGVPARLQVFARTQRQAAVAYGLPDVNPTLETPEERLREVLADIVRSGDLSPPDPARAYGVGETLHAGWDAAQQEFRAFVEQVRGAILTYARVETRVDGRLLARTDVGWSGNATSVYQMGLLWTQAAEHERVLGLALASRAAMLRTIGLAARGALILAQLGIPGGMVLALPAAWRFVRDVLAEREMG